MKKDKIHLKRILGEITIGAPIGVFADLELGKNRSKGWIDGWMALERLSGKSERKDGGRSLEEMGREIDKGQLGYWGCSCHDL